MGGGGMVGMVRRLGLCFGIFALGGCTREPDRVAGGETTNKSRSALEVPGLVAAYSFDEGTGTTLGDLSGSANSGAIAGAAWTQGIYGNALSFDGVDDWVTIADANSLDLTTGMTLEAWVNPSVRQGWQTAIMKESGGDGAYSLYVNDGGDHPASWVKDASGYVEAASPVPIPLDRWTHLAATQDATSLKFYVNGAVLQSVTASGALVTGSDPLRIGGNGLWGEWFQGAIDDVRVYNRALSAAEVEADMDTPIADVPSDITPPSVAITSPADGADVSDSVTLTATASDNATLVGVRFFLDGVGLDIQDTSSPFAFVWNTDGVTGGTHTLTARARDAAGNATSASITVTVGNGPAGLVAAYNFNEGEGTLAADQSGNNPGTLSSGTTWSSSGKHGGAASFDGGEITVEDSETLDLTTAMTLEAWVRPASFPFTSAAVITKAALGSLSYSLSASDIFGGIGPGPGTRVGNPGGINWAFENDPLPLDAWSHLAATYEDGSSFVRVYVNGELVGSGAAEGPIVPSDEPLRLGGFSFDGLIDDVRIYSRVLSAAEIQTDMDAPVTATDSTSPSVAITSPLDEATLSGSTTITAEASDDLALTGVRFLVDGLQVGAEDISAPFSIDWDTLTVGNGAHTLTARARDASGNTASSDITITVNNGTNGLVAAYNFDEGEGTSAADVSGNLNTGVLDGTTWSESGKHGGAASFDGDGDSVVVAASGTLDLTTAMTLEAWVRPSTLPTWTAVVAKLAGGGISYGLFASDTTEPIPGDGTPGTWINTSEGLVPSLGPNGLPLDEWSHLAATYDGASLKFYLDGTLAATTVTEGAITTTDGDLRIGGGTVWGEWFDGLIDDVRVYSRALTPEEIADDMEAPVGPTDPGDCATATLDDGNPCTTDACTPSTGVTHTPVATGTSCADGDACNGAETCDASGTCVGGTPVTCVASDQCHDAGTCNTTTGICSIPAKTNGTACSDDNACTESDTCQSGTCASGTAVATDDANPCTTDSCSPTTGVSHTPVTVGTSCSDGNACNGAEACNSSGSCVAGSPVTCLASDQCHDAGTCDTSTGVCSNPAKANGTSCSDGNACTAADACQAGTCTGGSAVATDDGNPCTEDACSSVAGVSHTPRPSGASCTDFDVCNGNETCDGAGTCQSGTPVPVDTTNACSDGACDPLTGVVTYTPLPQGTECFLDICATGACNGSGECTVSGSTALDDGDPCTVEWCDPDLGPQQKRCPDIERTVGTTLYSSMRWIYEPPSPIQIGVTAGTIVVQRAVALRGRATTRDGAPLPGVKVTVLDHPEFGYTLSHTDGYYDMVVNGGSALFLGYERDGYLHAQRSVMTQWGQFARVEDVALVALDPVVTHVDLTASGAFQVAQGSVQTDVDGTRRGTLLLPAGTQATMHLPNGTTEELDSLNVRITEFTVGANGETAMPGELPAESRYTYAFEVGADEAVAVNSPSVTFSIPLIYYVDNFLSFPAGTTVPLGSLDRRARQWKADQSGVVISLVGESAGLAQVDVTGDGIAESTSALAAFEITDAERLKLAELYDPGQSLWRLRLPHFTDPWDANWGGGPGPSATVPTGDGASGGGAAPPGCGAGGPGPRPPEPIPGGGAIAGLGDEGTGSNVEGGSKIECESQILRESLPVAGTPYSLIYSSNRQAGSKIANRIQIPISKTVPADLIRIDVDVDVAGRRVHQEFPASPNQDTTFLWDGRDAFGRELQGAQAATVSVGFVYPYVYSKTSRFGYNGNGLAITGDRGRGQITLASKTKVDLGPLDAKPLGFGGWTLDANHVLELGRQYLQLGNGRQLNAQSLSQVVELVVSRNGTGFTDQIAVAPDKSVYVAFAGGFQVFRAAPNGTVTLVAGNNSGGHAGDGLPASDPAVRISSTDMALGRDGSLYLVEQATHAVRRIGTDGIIRTFAGTTVLGHTGDGGPATSATLREPNSIALGTDGSVFIGDRVGIRRVAPDGTISTIAGTGAIAAGDPPLPSDGVAATTVRIEPKVLAVHPNGTLYAAIATNDTMGNRIVRFVDGRVYHVAGNGASFAGDGLPAKQSSVRVTSMAFDPDGRLYFADASSMDAVFNSRNTIRTINVVDGTITTVAGAGGVAGATPPAGTALTAMHLTTKDVAMGPDGFYGGGVAQGSYVYRAAAPFPSNTGSSLTVGDRASSAFFTFDASGRHVNTRHALTGANLLTFGYDSGGRLSTITDAANLTTHVERLANGDPSAIVSPFGQRTFLDVGPDGYLASVTDPDANQTQMEYTPDGLLTTYTSARGQVATMEYNELGLLEFDEDAAGGTQALNRVDSGRDFTVTRTTALGRSTSYAEHYATAGDQTKTVTDPALLHSSIAVHPNRVTDFVSADGTRVSVAESADARLGANAPIGSTTTTLPSGLTSASTTARQYTALNPANPLDFHLQTDSTTLNGQLWRTQYDTGTKTFTTTTPESRVSTRTIDALGRVIRAQLDGLAATNFAYDTSGRLQTMTQGSGTLTRTTSYGYVPTGASAGYLANVTDALTTPTTYSRDTLGRTLGETRAANTTAFTWDPESNLASVTPPGKPTHGMSYTPINLLETYSPPPASLPVSSTSYTYDPDRMLRTETRPDGVQIVRTPDSAGRLDTVAIPGGMLDYDYYASTLTNAAGKLSDVRGPYGVDLHFTYDGSLTKSVTWSGDVTGSVAWNYNPDLRKTLETVTGTSGTAQAVFGYDRDQLLTCASPTTCSPPGADALRLGRNTAGLINSVTLGSTSETATYNTFGELARQTATFSPSTPLVDITYDAAGVERDKFGRIVQKMEVIGGATKVYRYTYDASRRLTDVTVNGSLEEHFEYDANGNRTLGFNSTAGTTYTGMYDDQDRLLSYGPFDYTYTANGELETKTNRVSGEAWLFQYDVFGNLLTVGLPNGDLIDYLVDGMGRRVGKKKNGVLLKQWIYRDALKPVAELDGSGALVSEFVYGSKSNVPDYVRRGGATYRVLSDHLGSPRYVVNVANASDVPLTATYTSFGDVTGTGLDWMPFGFAGGTYDVDSGVVRFGARDYDATSGRWVSKDPIRFDGDGPNLYAYGLNDPVNNLDPDGKGAGGCAVALGRIALFCPACSATRSPGACRACFAATIAAAAACQPNGPAPPPPGPSCGTEGNAGSNPDGGYGGRNDGSAGYAGRSDGTGGGGRGSQ